MNKKDMQKRISNYLRAPRNKKNYVIDNCSCRPERPVNTTPADTAPTWRMVTNTKGCIIHGQ